MTAVLTPRASDAVHGHPAEASAARLGWRVCAVPPAAVVEVLPSGDRLRVIVAESLQAPGCPVAAGRAIDLAAELTARGGTAEEVADAVAGLGSGGGGGRCGVPSVSITLIDLHADGRAGIACRYAPSPMHARRDSSVQLLPPGDVPLARGDRLLAYTPDFLETQTPKALVELAEVAAGEADPCRLWDRIAPAHPAAEESEQRPVATLVVIARLAD